MTRKKPRPLLHTGVRNLDELLHGGFPPNSVVVVAGPPGSGKTILTQQISFHNAGPKCRVLHFNTLSEPPLKTLRNLSQFSFFNLSHFETSVRFRDLGTILRAEGIARASAFIMDEVKAFQPSIIVIDSFRVFDDLAGSRQELRRFDYELSAQLMAWEVSTFLLGEYSADDIQTNPLFSIVDGIVLMGQRDVAGEAQRIIRILKMRGTDHSRDDHTFAIRQTGVEVFAPRVTIHREDRTNPAPRLKTGITQFDDLLGPGIPRGSSLLIAGVPGSGKTLLLLEFLYRGALMGDKGVLFSFEETSQRLRGNARALGWDIDAVIESGLITIVFVPQPEIMVEGHLLMMREQIEALGVQRVAIDSVSVFLHKVSDPERAREKVFQLCSLVQNSQAVGFFATDIPYGATQISRMGVEETVVDGVVLLTATQRGLARHRYVEIYKLRNTAHLEGRHSMIIGPAGLKFFPRYHKVDDVPVAPRVVRPDQRLSSGVPGLDRLLGGGFLEGSVTLLSGSAGTGKSTIGIQFAAEGLSRGDRVLCVTLEENTSSIEGVARRLSPPLLEASRAGPQVEILSLSHTKALTSQLWSLVLEKVEAQGTTRLLLDSLSRLLPDDLEEDELRELLFALVARLKLKNVTTLLTVESTDLYASEQVTAHALSPLADNLLMLRFARSAGAIFPTLTVVKTRASEHDFGVYALDIGEKGVCIGPRMGESGPVATPRPRKGRKRKT